MVTFPTIDIPCNSLMLKRKHHYASLRSMLLGLETLVEIKLSFFVDNPVPL